VRRPDQPRRASRLDPRAARRPARIPERVADAAPVAARRTPVRNRGAVGVLGGSIGPGALTRPSCQARPPAVAVPVVVGGAGMEDNRPVPTTSVEGDAAATQPAADQPAADQPEHAPEPVAPPAPDAVCAAAVDLARAAAVEDAEPGTVGEHVRVIAEGERLVTHLFASTAKGYRGWCWAVTVARVPRSRTATVCEVVLLPADGAVLAPTWVPWSQRLAPGDLGPADALPYRADDPLLDPGYAATDDEDADAVALWELGLGRPRVLNAEGRDAAATRWYLGDRGPTADEALHAAAACASCGYFLPVAGGLRQVFGVCANEWSPSDGRVVSVDHGCGAHSETDVDRPEPEPLPLPILDETGADAVVLIPHEPAEAVAEVELTEPEQSEPEPEQSEPEQSEPESEHPQT
jgi:hypothetical protein